MESHALAVDRHVLPHNENASTLNVRHEIDGFLADHRCDLVVVGTKGLTGSNRLRLGSVADYLAHHVRCSILIVRDTYPTR